MEIVRYPMAVFLNFFFVAVHFGRIRQHTKVPRHSGWESLPCGVVYAVWSWKYSRCIMKHHEASAANHDVGQLIYFLVKKLTIT